MALPWLRDDTIPSSSDESDPSTWNRWIAVDRLGRRCFDGLDGVPPPSLVIMWSLLPLRCVTLFSSALHRQACTISAEGSQHRAPAHAGNTRTSLPDASCAKGQQQLLTTPRKEIQTCLPLKQRAHGSSACAYFPTPCDIHLRWVGVWLLARTRAAW